MAPIAPRPLLESEVQEAKSRGALGASVPDKAYRLRVVGFDLTTGEGRQVYAADLSGPSAYGARLQSIKVFDVRIVHGVLLLAFCDDMHLYGIVNDPTRHNESMLGRSVAVDVQPDGTYIRSPRIMAWQELEAVAPRAAKFEGTGLGDDLKLNVHSETGDLIRFELKRDGEGFCWFRPNR